MKTLKVSKLSDQDLIIQVQKSRNAQAFEQLYIRYNKLVYNKCYSFVHNGDDASDLTQDIFVRVYIKLNTFKGDSKFSTWLFSFTYNHCVNFVQRDKNYKMQREGVAINDQQQLEINVDDYSLYQLKEQRLKIALDLLPPEERVILLLKYQDDIPIKELMVTYSLGESAVKMRLKRAKANLIQLYHNKT